MFFALKGENFDGNDYAIDALKAGAKYAVVDRVSLEGETWRGSKCILVENVLNALQQLARYHRMQFDIPVIGITGTNGKTTTKELISKVLSQKYNVVCTEGNFNNAVGVPLTLFKMEEKSQIAVVEMGASAPGEISQLVQIVNPTCGLVTNVGKAHLLGFGSFEGVIKTKGELYDFLRQSGGTVFYNVDNEYLSDMVNNRKGMALRKYGVKYQGVEVLQTSPDNPFLGLKMSAEDGPVKIVTNLVGAYNADNVLAALCVADYFEVPFKKAATAIEQYTPSNSRSQLVKTERNSLIVDAYNANPTSMGAALDNFSAMKFENKTLILGDMLELGTDSQKEHKEILKKALGITDSVYLVGKEFSIATKMTKGCGKIKVFDNADQLVEYISANPIEGRTILIKGSNGTRLHKIPEFL